MGAILSPHGFYCYMTKKNKQSDGWNEWEKLVLSKLESHDNNISDILKQVQTANEHLFSFKLDVSKAKRELDFEPVVSLEEGLRKTIEYWRNKV